MTSAYTNPRWIKERPTAMLDAVTLIVGWLSGIAAENGCPRAALVGAPTASGCCGDRGDWRAAA